MGLKLSDWSKMYYFHPTFLYESLWNLLGFALINLIYRKKKFDGQIALMYFTWYGFGRMFIEGLRTDSLYIGSFRISQLVAAGSFVLCLALLIVGFCLAHRRKLAEGDYNVVYGRLSEEKAEKQEDADNKKYSENIEENEENDNGKTD